MSSALIINLGSQDLNVTKENIGKLKEIFSDDKEMLDILNNDRGVYNRFREFTKKLNEAYPKGLELVEFPIIKPVLERICKEFDGEKIDRIMFVATNQREANNLDTVNLADLIIKINKDNNKELLAIKEKLGFYIKDKKNNNKNKLTIGKVLKYEIAENPSDYDLMINKYTEILSKQFFNIDKIYISMAPGTPAMSVGILYASAFSGKSSIIPYYSSKGNGINKLKIAETLQRNSKKNQICSFVSKQNYKAAESLFLKYKNDFGISSNQSTRILNLIDFAQHRIQFNFEEAKECINHVKDDFPDSREVCNRFLKTIENLNDKKQIYLLNELKDNAIYQYNNGDYTDLLGRVFRLREEIYSRILLKIGIAEEKNGNKIYILEKKLSLEQKEKLDTVKLDGNSLEYLNKELSSEAMSSILENIVTENSEEFKLINMCSKLKSLKDLRNKTILAHGYTGISKYIIDNNVKEIKLLLNELIEEFKNLFKEEIDVDDFYYKDGEFNNYLINLIREL